MQPFSRWGNETASIWRELARQPKTHCSRWLKDAESGRETGRKLNTSLKEEECDKLKRLFQESRESQDVRWRCKLVTPKSEFKLTEEGYIRQSAAETIDFNRNQNVQPQKPMLTLDPEPKTKLGFMQSGRSHHGNFLEAQLRLRKRQHIQSPKKTYTTSLVSAILVLYPGHAVPFLIYTAPDFPVVLPPTISNYSSHWPAFSEFLIVYVFLIYINLKVSPDEVLRSARGMERWAKFGGSWHFTNESMVGGCEKYFPPTGMRMAGELLETGECTSGILKPGFPVVFSVRRHLIFGYQLPS
ncbi:uncharacterized protein BDR25DRAFT_391138, partial [Lindgomyces ingoldianus]